MMNVERPCLFGGGIFGSRRRVGGSRGTSGTIRQEMLFLQIALKIARRTSSKILGPTSSKIVYVSKYICKQIENNESYKNSLLQNIVVCPTSNNIPRNKHKSPS